MPLDNFLQKKHSILNEIQQNSIDNPDFSPKGTIDTLIVPLIDQINLLSDYVTTSSCSGRSSVFLEGVKQNRPGGKGLGGKWLFVTHNIEEVESNWWIDVKTYTEEAQEESRYILYKYEPMILHVKARDFESASKLYSIAMSCGFRESGIGSNHIVAIRTSMSLDLPIAKLTSDGAIEPLVTDKYIQETIIPLSKDMFIKNNKKMDSLSEKLRFLTDEVSRDPIIESKDERRARKRAEGLAKQALLRENDNVSS